MTGSVSLNGKPPEQAAPKRISLRSEQTTRSREDKTRHGEDGFVESRLCPGDKKDGAASRVGRAGGTDAAGSGRAPLKANTVR